MQLVSLISMYGGTVFRAWLNYCWDVGFAHGSELAHALPGADNNYAADRLLDAAVEAGWLLRSEYATPTFNQRAWLSLERGRGKKVTHYGREFGYSPNRASLGARMYLSNQSEAR